MCFLVGLIEDYNLHIPSQKLTSQRIELPKRNLVSQLAHFFRCHATFGECMIYGYTVNIITTFFVRALAPSPPMFAFFRKTKRLVAFLSILTLRPEKTVRHVSIEQKLASISTILVGSKRDPFNGLLLLIIQYAGN